MHLVWDEIAFLATDDLRQASMGLPRVSGRDLPNANGEAMSTEHKPGCAALIALPTYPMQYQNCDCGSLPVAPEPTADTAAEAPGTYMDAHDVMAAYVNGDETTWADEFDFLLRNHADALADLMRSVSVVGFQRPVVLDEGEHRVIDGHHRLFVAALLGMYVPVSFDLADAAAPAAVPSPEPPAQAHLTTARVVSWIRQCARLLDMPDYTDDEVAGALIALMRGDGLYVPMDAEPAPSLSQEPGETR